MLLGNHTYVDKTRIHFVRKSTQWSILIFSMGQRFLQGTTTLKMHKSSIDHISHILENGQHLLHRVTTHKIYISTNDANFIHSQIITISCFSITCLNSIPLYKRKCSHYHYYITSVTNSTIYHKSPSPSDNLWRSALLHYNGNTLLLTGFEVSS